MKYIILILLASACSIETHLEGFDTTIVGNDASYGPVAEEYGYELTALLIIKDRLDYLFSTDFDISEIDITWVESNCLQNTPDEFNGICLSGLHFSCAEMFAIKRPYLSRSAFAHELFHCFSTQFYGDADNGHTSPLWAPVMTDITKRLKIWEGNLLNEEGMM